MHCPEKALALGLIVKEEDTPSEVVEIQQDLQVKLRKTRKVLPLTQPEVSKNSEVFEPQKAIPDEMKPCTCKNGKCAKKYCVCLKRAGKCDPTLCSCRDCENLDSNEAETRRQD